MNCPRCGKENMDHICEMGMCELKVLKELKNVEIAVHFGKQNDEECHIIIKGTLDQEFFEELQALMLEHSYTESL